MRRLIAFALAATLLLGGLSAPAQASTEAAVALGLASFALFNQLFWPVFGPRVVYYPPPYYYPSAPYAAPPPSYVTPPPAAAPAAPTVIYYSHGRYELRGDGVTTPYVWVWIPSPPPPPPPPAPSNAPPPGTP